MSRTVLIVDDNPDMCELFSVAFSTVNYKVITAYNGKDALDLLATHDIDIITLDYNMPGLSGIDVLRQIKAIKQFQSIKVIMVTANDFIVHDEVALELADLTLLKPVSFSQLVQLANRLMMQSGV